MVVVVWRDDDAPSEWDRQTAEHAGLTSDRRHRVVR
jgi:heme-degrading monooxygenase HmoA